MSVIVFSKQFLLRLLILMVFINLAAFAATALGWKRASAENGLIENAQLVLLTISLVAGVLASLWSAELLRVAMAGWVAVMLLMIQREIDFSMNGVESWLYGLSHSTVRLAFWLPLVAGLLVWLWPYRGLALRSIAAAKWSHLWPALLVGVLMLGSELTEEVIDLDVSGEYVNMLVFLEELFELSGYCVVAAVGFAIAVRVLRPGSPEEVASRNRLDPEG